MAGGLMQLVTYGTQDLTLTGNPQITFFYIVYRRYTNFGKKMIELSFNNSPNFNQTSYINIPKNNGDLLSQLILKITLPKIDFTQLNSLLQDIIVEKSNYNSYLTYYNYFIIFYNKLKNIINNFFLKYDINYTSLTYITDLKNYILNYFNIDQYSQFFSSIDFFFNDINSITNEIKYNVSLYTNASLFKIINNDLIYIYESFTYQTLSYEGFKFTINNNISILDELNTFIYNKLSNILYTKDNIQIAWVNKIGIYLFNSIEFYIGSNKIYSLSDSYINNYSELYYKNPELYDEMIGNNSNSNKFSTILNENILYLPIPFWSLSNYGLAFPLIALQYNSLQIKINTKKLLDCVRIQYAKQYYTESINAQIINTLVNNLNSIVQNNLNITLLAELIYLDSVERKKFAISSHEYLIEQVQEIEFNQLTSSNNTFQLEIFHCCKDMFWFAQKIPTSLDIFSNNLNVFNYLYNREQITLPQNVNDFINYFKMINNPKILFNPFIYYNGINIINNNLKYIDLFNFILDYFSNSYIYPSQNSNLDLIIAESYFNLNGIQLFGENYSYFNHAQPYAYYNSTPELGLNSYSFCIRPTEFQPSGSCNMSKISFIGLKLKINLKQLDKLEELTINTYDYKNVTKNDDEYKLIFQVRNYNVLRLVGGIGATAYTY